MRRPTMTAYKPTVRDMVARQALNLFGDTYANRNLARNFFGSSGLGSTGEMSVADFTPAGVGFAADEAGRQAGQGHPWAAAGNLALAALPIPGRKAVATAGRAVAGKAKGMVSKALKHRLPLPDGYSVPNVDLPSRSNYRVPLIPTAAQMDRFGRIERVPLSKVEANEPNSSRRWDRFSQGDSPGAVVEGYGTRPLAVRQESGEYIIYDGHHRTQRALSQGSDDLEMNVIDARNYDPENAGRAPRPYDQQEIDDLARELFGDSYPIEKAAAPAKPSAPSLSRMGIRLPLAGDFQAQPNMFRGRK